jgi:tRNA/rRNA methyltransferase
MDPRKTAIDPAAPSGRDPRRTAIDPARTRIVLHRPHSAENLGAAARVMKNLGLSRLVVVAPPSWSGRPRGGGPGTARDDVLARARRTARKASDLLDGVEVHADLRAALGPSVWTCATTSRTIEGRTTLGPRDLAAEVARRGAEGDVAIVFGEERRGLSDAELSLCQAVCTIPTARAYDSMNLAQAVAVVAYELAMASAPAGARTAPAAAGAGPARHATRQALWEATRELLAAAGFLNPQQPELILAELRRVLDRAEPTQREVELLAAAVRALSRKLLRG